MGQQKVMVTWDMAAPAAPCPEQSSTAEVQDVVVVQSVTMQPSLSSPSASCRQILISADWCGTHAICGEERGSATLFLPYLSLSALWTVRSLSNSHPLLVCAKEREL